jgi:hypothetical protein
MEGGAGWAVVDGRSCSGLASYTKPDTGRLVRKEVTLYGIWRGGDGRQTQKRGRPKRASTQQIAFLHLLGNFLTLLITSFSIIYGFKF